MNKKFTTLPSGSAAPYNGFKKVETTGVIDSLKPQYDTRHKPIFSHSKGSNEGSLTRFNSQLLLFVNVLNKYVGFISLRKVYCVMGV